MSLHNNFQFITVNSVWKSLQHIAFTLIFKKAVFIIPEWSEDQGFIYY
jgi:hypothetical protein